MKNILQFLGLLLLLILSFLGANYLLNGEIIMAGGISVLLVVLMYFLVDFFIKRKSHISKSKISALSILLWFFFIVLSLPISFFSIHAFNVELNVKQDTKAYVNELIDKNKRVIRSFTATNNDYIIDLHTALKNDLFGYVHSPRSKSALGIKLSAKPYNISDLSTINKNNYTDIADAIKYSKILKSEQLLDSINTRTNEVLTRNIKLVNNWSRLRIPSSILEIENMCDQNLQQINQFSCLEHKDDLSFINWTDSTNTSESLADFGIEQTSKNRLVFKKENIDFTDFLICWNNYKPYWIIIPNIFLIILLILPYIVAPKSGVYMKKDSDTEKRLGDKEIGGIEL